MAYELGKDPVTIGRGDECTIRLEDRVASRRHARVYCMEEQWWVEDLASRNGTFVNGQQISGPQRLHRDDRVQIGQALVVFKTDVDLLDQTWADKPVLSSPAQEDTAFEHAVERHWFQQQAFDTKDLEFLYRISSILSAGAGLPRLARDALSAIRTFFKADVACLFLSERAKPPIQPALVLSDATSPMVSQTVVLYTIRTRCAVCVRNTRTELPPTDVLNLMGEGRSRSLMCAPLVCRDKVLGALLVDRDQPDFFDSRSLALFMAIAHQIGNDIFLLQEMTKLEAIARATEGDPLYNEALIGSSPAVAKLRQRIAEVADSDQPVLIVGERGSGKHEVAHAIHSSSPRMRGPLVWFHALATEPNQIAASLFGMEPAQPNEFDPANRGKIEDAHSGTLVIEEIGTLPVEVQRALQISLKTLQFTRVGGQRRYLADIRVIATTSDSLEDTVTAGKFDEELFQTISGLTVAIPPLRERGEDVIELAERFARRAAPWAGRREITLAPPVQRALQMYRWLGNIRELRNTIERAVLRCRGDKVNLADLPPDMLAQVQSAVQPTVVESQETK